MASIEQRRRVDPTAPPSWRVYWRLGGRGGPKQSVTLPSEDLAESAARLAEARHHKVTDDEVYAAVLGLDQQAATVPTLAEWSRTWAVQRRELGAVEDGTIDTDMSILMRRILPKLGNLRLTMIDRDTVKDWVAWMNSRPSKNGGIIDADTVRRAHAVLRNLLGAAVPRYLDNNPAGRLPGQSATQGLPKATPHEAVFLEPGEIELILANCKPTVRDMAYVSLRTGLRLGELLVLRPEDVTLTGRRKLIRVRRALKRNGRIGEPKSRRSRRDVSISTEVAQTIAEHATGHRRHELIFTTPAGRVWDRHNLRREWIAAFAAAQRCPDHMPPLPEKPKRGPRRQWRPDEVSVCDCATRLHRTPRWHDLRHTHASLLIEAGWRETRVSRRLGHESIKTTVDIYGHLWETDDEDRLDAVEKLLAIAEDEAA